MVPLLLLRAKMIGEAAEASGEFADLVKGGTIGSIVGEIGIFDVSYVHSMICKFQS
jgi:hypothetical protein